MHYEILTWPILLVRRCLYFLGFWLTLFCVCVCVFFTVLCIECSFWHNLNKIDHNFKTFHTFVLGSSYLHSQRSVVDVFVFLWGMCCTALQGNSQLLKVELLWSWCLLVPLYVRAVWHFDCLDIPDVLTDWVCSLQWVNVTWILFVAKISWWLLLLSLQIHSIYNVGLWVSLIHKFEWFGI